MADAYWGSNVNPEEDDYDIWIDPDREDPEAEDDDPVDEEGMEETLQELYSIIEDVGPPTVLEVTAEYLYTLPRPFHRVAKKVRDLGERARRAIGAVEEAKQTRGIR